jgi:hypothetical protein
MFLAVIDDRDTLSQEVPSHRVAIGQSNQYSDVGTSGEWYALETLGVNRQVMPSRDIVILQEVTKKGHVLSESDHISR